MLGARRVERLRRITAEIAQHGGMEGNRIRTTTIYPAAINTELLTKITDEPSREQMQNLYDQFGIPPDRIASVVAIAIGQPDHTTINEFAVGPASQPW